MLWFYNIVLISKTMFVDLLFTKLAILVSPIERGMPKVIPKLS